MRSSPGIALALCLALAPSVAWAEEHCCGAKERALAQGRAARESSAKAGAPAHWGSDRPWADYNRRIRWHENVETAQRTAVAQNKMLFVMQVVGNLRDEGC